MSAAHFSALVSLLFFLGCGTSEPATDAGSVEFDSGGVAPVVELGTGTSAFEMIPATGGELELVGGAQGGFHVFVAARLRGLDPEGMTLSFSATDVATGANVGTPAVFNLVLARVQRDSEGFIRTGDFLVLNDMSSDGLEGLTLDVTVVAEAASGRSATDHRVVTIVDNEGG